MEINSKEISPLENYKLLAGFITPRPIAFVTTISDSGIVNAAPFSFFNAFGSKPPIVAFAPGNRQDGSLKDTAANVISQKEFVVNLVDESIGQQMHESSIDLPPDKSELKFTGLTTCKSVKIKTPMIAEAPVSLECKLEQIVNIGQNRIVFGEVLYYHIKDSLIDSDKLRVITENYNPIGRMHGADGYCTTENYFTLTKPIIK